MLRLKNIQRNNARLAFLGLLSKNKGNKCMSAKTNPRVTKQKKMAVYVPRDVEPRNAAKNASSVISSYFKNQENSSDHDDNSGNTSDSESSMEDIELDDDDSNYEIINSKFSKQFDSPNLVVRVGLGSEAIVESAGGRDGETEEEFVTIERPED